MNRSTNSSLSSHVILTEKMHPKFEMQICIFFIEASIAVLVAFIINVFVVAVFAAGLSGHKNSDIVFDNNLNAIKEKG